jgi:hypothetical protein
VVGGDERDEETAKTLDRYSAELLEFGYTAGIGGDGGAATTGRGFVKPIIARPYDFYSDTDVAHRRRGRKRKHTNSIFVVCFVIFRLRGFSLAGSKRGQRH